VKMCGGVFKFYQKCDKVTGSLHEDLCRFLIIFRSVLRIPDKSCRKKNKQVLSTIVLMLDVITS
jgi:hypothetical protein